MFLSDVVIVYSYRFFIVLTSRSFFSVSQAQTDIETETDNPQFNTILSVPFQVKTRKY